MLAEAKSIATDAEADQKIVRYLESLVSQIGDAQVVHAPAAPAH
jgi:hypothetical protein